MNDATQEDTAEARFATIVEALRDLPGVSVGKPGKGKAKAGFGAGALQVEGKIFAMIADGGRFVVKLPKGRVDAMVGSGDGERFDPGHGRLMKEWLVVRPESGGDWLVLAREALRFVGSTT